MYLGYLAIFLVGVVGNIIVLVVVLTNPHMQTTTNIYVVNLSLADILMCLGIIILLNLLSSRVEHSHWSGLSRSCSHWLRA